MSPSSGPIRKDATVEPSPLHKALEHRECDVCHRVGPEVGTYIAHVGGRTGPQTIYECMDTDAAGRKTLRHAAVPGYELEEPDACAEHPAGCGRQAHTLTAEAL